MPKYKFDLTVEIEAKDIDEVECHLDDIESPNVRITYESPSVNNPPDYPEE